jgi:Spy/CpxP family protein refolding chaperone
MRRRIPIVLEELTMNRRALVALPGIAALAATRAVGRTSDPDASTGAVVLPHVTRKALSKHSGAKSAYKIPKNAAKQAKYVGMLTALLSLTAGQQQQIAAILSNAGATRATLHINLKAARKALSGAVQGNDSGAISQASGTLGTIMTQYVSNGAQANAAIFQLLTSAQQATLTQFMG